MHKISDIISRLKKCSNTDFEEIEFLSKQSLEILIKYLKSVKSEQEYFTVNNEMVGIYGIHNHTKSNGSKSDKGSKSNLDIRLSSVSYIQVEETDDLIFMD